MHEKGGLIGLHGYTHQYRTDETAVGYEFMDKGSAVYASPAYAEDRVKKSLELAKKAGIPIDFWETPHYTASPEQYQLMSNYFGLMYEPNPRDKQSKNISSWDSTGFSNQGMIFVPAPLLNINQEKDVDRILSQLDKNDPEMLASFFFHPFQEFRFMYKMKAPEGYEFYVHDTNSYLHRLINGFKERGYKFVTVNDLIGFVPAQRLSGLPSTTGKVLLTGDFDGKRRSDILCGDPATGRWLVVKSQIDRAIPRNNPQSFSPPEKWLSNWGQGDSKEFAVGDFNGDGKKDLAVLDKGTGTVWVALGDGSKFVPSNGGGDQTWMNDFAAGDRWQVLAGDFSGSGIDGLAAYDSADGQWELARSTGKEFSREDWPVTWGKDGKARLLVGDFNGDGKSDLAIDRHFGEKTVVDFSLSVINNN